MGAYQFESGRTGQSGNVSVAVPVAAGHYVPVAQSVPIGGWQNAVHVVEVERSHLVEHLVDHRTDARVQGCNGVMVHRPVIEVQRLIEPRHVAPECIGTSSGLLSPS